MLIVSFRFLYEDEFQSLVESLEGIDINTANDICGKCN